MLFPNMSREALKGALSRELIVSTCPIKKKNQKVFVKKFNIIKDDICVVYVWKYGKTHEMLLWLMSGKLKNDEKPSFWQN